ncbi:hypothetical protein DUNSADRAFT_6540 [Dunaliella salina]|uniref:Encoded protein n=1 Tax=Dunaliella salina TaxID=3046 RepID=A0ABQ7GN30_DUNSA|nr:hypothetical protein DUNSADRAFT_6540 [Dunaliella salina]|eukprot:KAF5836019.1 hypothetical protein DUNSADRAFT_6540 [Dunaliella salina]
MEGQRSKGLPGIAECSKKKINITADVRLVTAAVVLHGENPCWGMRTAANVHLSFTADAPSHVRMTWCTTTMVASMKISQGTLRWTMTLRWWAGVRRMVSSSGTSATPGGSYWGVNGFFRIRRGVNALQIEAGDCWYAVPTWDMEQDVAEGRLVGSMYGVHPRGTPVPDFQAFPSEYNAQRPLEEEEQLQQQAEKMELGNDKSRMNGNRKIIQPA